ncbi:uncharacterized protein LOC116343930 [Contarinia nasturtii]|uniref:uncharacterized protein LOC116343930 n=1 Tax=Contarinia nasturtii TaxID=265458 RepID=UPI0012D42D4C|nr:uncharacterized protein LOC116343930 [Contarinia nasturtii]
MPPLVRRNIFRFNVPNISALNMFYSPEFMVHAPWQIKIKKKTQNGQLWLFAVLCCRFKDKSSTWSYNARASIKLLRQQVDHEENSIEKHTTPTSFVRQMKRNPGVYVIRWSDVFDMTKGYVENDTICLEIKIEVADPSEHIKSDLVLENTYKSCKDGCQTKFQLTVSNITGLMTIQSPPFNLRNALWYFLIYKNHSKHLCLRLHPCDTLSEFSYEITMSIELVSSFANGKCIKRVETKQMHHNTELKLGNLISWDDLCEAKNGFVNNNCIVINVEINTEKPIDVISNTNTKYKAMNLSIEETCFELECPTCLEIFEEKELSFTHYRHIFCSDCLKNAMSLL